jgi:hypothetical protein
MSRDFQTIFVTVRPPRDGDCGVVEQGYFRTEDDSIVLVDARGVPRLNKKGKRLEYKLKPGQNARTIAALLVRDHLSNHRDDFHRKIIYPNVGNF